jgi:hypothetical protein
MPEIALLHAGFGRALVLYLAALALWGILAWRRNRGISPSYRGALLIGWLAALAQGVLGAVLSLATPPRDPLHILYGVAILVALPVGFLYARERTPAQQSLVLGLASLFSSGLAIRGLTTV